MGYLNKCSSLMLTAAFLTRVLKRSVMDNFSVLSLLPGISRCRLEASDPWRSKDPPHHKLSDQRPILKDDPASEVSPITRPTGARSDFQGARERSRAFSLAGDCCGYRFVLLLPACFPLRITSPAPRLAVPPITAAAFAIGCVDSPSPSPIARRRVRGRQRDASSGCLRTDRVARRELSGSPRRVSEPLAFAKVAEVGCRCHRARSQYSGARRRRLCWRFSLSGGGCLWC